MKRDAKGKALVLAMSFVLFMGGVFALSMDRGNGRTIVLVFVVLGGAQVLQGCGIEVDGIGAVNGDVLSREGLKVVIKDFGVGPLLVGGEEKDLLDDL